MAGEDARTDATKETIMKTKSYSLLAAILIAAAVTATAGLATVGGAILSAGDAEARTLNSSQPRRIAKPERKIDFGQIKNVEPAKRRLLGGR
jgi:hypothetical protein